MIWKIWHKRHPLQPLSTPDRHDPSMPDWRGYAPFQSGQPHERADGSRWGSAEELSVPWADGDGSDPETRSLCLIAAGLKHFPPPRATF